MLALYPKMLKNTSNTFFSTPEGDGSFVRYLGRRRNTRGSKFIRTATATLSDEVAGTDFHLSIRMFQ